MESPQEAARRLTAGIGNLESVYEYRNLEGEPIFANLRIILRNGRKTFRLMSHTGGGFELRRDESLKPPAGWPLYGLATLERPGAVWVVEGEKDVDSLSALGLPCVTSGSTSTDGNADWSPLAGCEVILWPDNDDAGKRYMERIAEILRELKADVSTIDVDTLELAKKEDCSDWLEKHSGAGADDILALIPQPLNTAELLECCRGWVQRYLNVTAPQGNVLAAWIMLSWSVDAFDLVPYLHITSAEKQSGKTRVLEVLNAVVNRPWFTGRVTAAVLARKVDQEKPTLLLDEIDAAMGSGDEYTEAVRGILNSGFSRNGKVSVCVGKGAEVTFRDLSCFGPKAFAGIGKIPDTVADRSIVILMRRKLDSEKVERFRERDVRQRAKPIIEALNRWAKPNIQALREARPELPEAFKDRQQDISEPLIAIADLAGGDWPGIMRWSLSELFGSSAAEDTSIGVMLLRDIHSVFGDPTGPDADKISSNDLITALRESEGQPWADWNHGKGLTVNNLARELKKYAIYPNTIRSSTDRFKGYSREMFTDAWKRYCPDLTHSPPF